MKGNSVLITPVSVDDVRLTVGAMTPADLDNYGFQLAKVADVLAPHDGTLSDLPGLVKITAKGGKWGSTLFGFAIHPDFAGKKDAPVKKGTVIGKTATPDGLVTWSAFVPRPTAANKNETMAIHPLILAGALGGIEYTGMVGALGWYDDMKKALDAILSKVGAYAIAFGAGWLLGKR